MEIKIEKSYVVIDTPEECHLCELSCLGRYDELWCPLVKENVGSPNGYGGKHEKCPLKKMTIAAEIEV